MGASVGFGLLKALIDDRISLSSLTEKGIDESYFQGKEREAYRFVRSYFMDYAAFPREDTIKIEIDDTSCFQNLPDEIPEFWESKVRERKRFNLSQSGITQVRSLLEVDDVESAVLKFGEIYSELRDTYKEFQVRDLKAVQREVLDRHYIVQHMSTIPGIPFGFPYLDAVSGGAQPGDSNIIAGITGSGKTNLSLKCALSGFYAGYSVLYLCTEMPILQVARRALAMEAGFDSTYLKLGTLSGFAVARASNLIDTPLQIEGEDCTNFFKLLPGGIYANFEDILVVTRETNPDLLVIDGASLVRLPNFRGNRWERMIEVMERVKSLAMTEHIATLSTYHFGKQSPGTVEGMYGGLAMGQLASMVLAFEFERKEDVDSSNPVQYRILKLLKGRDGETGAIRVLYDMIRSAIDQDRVISGYAALGRDDTNEGPAYVDDEPYAEV